MSGWENIPVQIVNRIDKQHPFGGGLHDTTNQRMSFLINL